MTEPAKCVYEFGEFQLDRVNKTLLRKGILVPLTPKVFDTLLLLVERPGQLVEKDEFVRQLWPETFVEDAALAENISRLRRALGDADTQRIIATVPKRGYRFIAAVNKVNLTNSARTAALAPTKSATRHRVGLALLGIAILVIIGGTYLYSHQHGPMFARPPWVPIRALAVLPLENLSRDPE